MTPEGLTPGATLQAVTHTFTTLDLFLFSAAGWHPHRIHFDQDYAREAEGHPALLVHGPLQAVHIFQALTDQLPTNAELVSARYRHLAPLLVGVPATMNGEITAADEKQRTIEVDLWMERTESGERTTTGHAVVRLLAT